MEDEPLARELIEDYILNIPWIKLSASFATGMEALAYLDEHQREIDFLILDIKMPRLSGISVLDCLKTDIPVIFTTAYSDYAVQSYEYNTIDYLTKPVSFDRFLVAVLKVKKYLQKSSVESAPERAFIFVKTKAVHEKIWIDQILWVEGMADYVKIVTAEKAVLLHSSMKSMAESLPSSFIRCHQSYLINTKAVNKVYGNILMVEKQEIPIGRVFKKDVMDFFGLT